MAVGRNVAYRAEAYPFKELVRQLTYISGDDDLVFQSLDAKWRIQGELDPKAFVFARGKSSWKTWFGQKRRHFNVVNGYSLEKSRIPALFRLLQIIWIAAAFGIIATANYSYILLSLLPIGGFAFVLYKWRNALRLQNPIVGVFLEPLRYLVVVSVTISLLIKRPKKW